MGGMVVAIESGYIDREIAKSAYQYQREIETGERVVVGVNKFIGEDELEVTTSRLVPDPYNPEKRAKAGERQIANLTEVRKRRDNKAVEIALKELKGAAQDENINIIPALVEAVKTYASVGEICDTLKQVFGTYQQPEL